MDTTSLMAPTSKVTTDKLPIVPIMTIGVLLSREIHIRLKMDRELRTIQAKHTIMVPDKLSTLDHVVDNTISTVMGIRPMFLKEGVGKISLTDHQRLKVITAFDFNFLHIFFNTNIHTNENHFLFAFDNDTHIVIL